MTKFYGYLWIISSSEKKIYKKYVWKIDRLILWRKKNVIKQNVALMRKRDNETEKKKEWIKYKSVKFSGTKTGMYNQP